MSEPVRDKFGGRDDYFAVNNKPAGVSTSFRVSGRLGELARRFWNPSDAMEDCKRLNRAYLLGVKHAAGRALDQSNDEVGRT